MEFVNHMKIKILIDTMYYTLEKYSFKVASQLPNLGQNSF